MARWIVLIACLLVQTASPAWAGAPLGGSAPLSRSKDGKFYVVEALLNHERRASLLVDTGASETILTDWFAKDAGIPFAESGEDSGDSSGRKFQVYRSKIGEARVGDRVVRDPRFAVVSFPAFPKEEGIAGLFSPQSFFANEEVLIDFPRNRLAWGTPVAAKDRAQASVAFHPCVPAERSPFIRVSVDGVEGRFLLDTGGFKSAVTKVFAAKLGRTSSSKSRRKGISGTRQVDTLERVRVSVGGISGSIDVDVEDQVNGCPIADGKFGIEWLSRFGVRLSADRATVAFLR